MKKRYLAISILLLLSIFMMGAVSASDNWDNSTIVAGEVQELSSDNGAIAIENGDNGEVINCDEDLTAENEEDAQNLSAADGNVVGENDDEQVIGESDRFHLNISDYVDMSNPNSVVVSFYCPDADGAVKIGLSELGSSWTLSYYFGQSEYNKTFNYTRSDLGISSAGKYTITIVFEGFNQTNQTRYSKPVKIIDPGSVITPENFTVKIYDEVIIGSANENVVEITAPKEVYGNITVILGDKKFNKYTSIQNYKIKFNLSDLNITSFGTYQVKVQFDPEDDDGIMDLGQNNVLVTYLFKLIPVDEYGDPCYSFGYKDTLKVKVNLTDGWDGNLRVFINEIEKEVDENLYFTIGPEDLSLGEMNLTASLTSDSYYPDRTVRNSFMATPYFLINFMQENYVFSFTASTSDEVYLLVDVPDNVTGAFYLYTSTGYGGNQPVDLLGSCEVNGTTKCLIPLDKLNVNRYNNLFASFESQDYAFNSSDQIMELNLRENSDSVNVALNPSVIKEGQTANLRITGPRNEMGLKIYVDGQYLNQSYDLSTGRLDLAIGNDLTVGEHNIHVRLNYNVFYSDSVKLTVENASKPNGNASGNDTAGNDTNNASDVIKIVAKDYSAFYNNAVYSIKVYKNGKAVNGVKVIFKINGKKFASVKTNKKGIASVKIKLVPKKYRIICEALGVKATKTLKIKQVLKLKKTKVRKSARKLVLKATLKEGKKPLRNKKITFRFNGKKFKAKTNKKGIAKVTIKKKFFKKLKVGKKVKIKATYIKDTVNKTVRVKK